MEGLIFVLILVVLAVFGLINDSRPADPNYDPNEYCGGVRIVGNESNKNIF